MLKYYTAGHLLHQQLQQSLRFANQLKLLHHQVFGRSHNCHCTLMLESLIYIHKVKYELSTEQAKKI